MTDIGVDPVVKTVLAAFTGSGSQAVAGHLDERSVLHMPGGSGLAGDYEGRAAICALLERMTTETDGTLRFEVTCTIVSSVGRFRSCGTVSGGRWERTLATTATLETAIAGGVVREAWLSCADQAAWDAFWG